MHLSNGITEKIIANGGELVTKIVGNQKSMQKYGADGKLLKTTLKKVENHIFKSITPRRIGFIQEPVNEASREVRSVTRNVFDSVENKSVASIVDSLFIGEEKVGERIIINGVDYAPNYPMRAMEELRNGTYKKILRYFQDGKLKKESITQMVDGKRVSRTIRNHDAEIELSRLRNEYYKHNQDLQKQTMALEKQLSELTSDRQLVKLKKSISDDFDHMIDINCAIRDLEHNATMTTLPITAEEKQIQIKNLKAQEKKINQRWEKKKQQFSELQDQLGITKLADEYFAIMGGHTPEAKELSELGSKIYELEYQAQLQAQKMFFNGASLAEKIGDKTFSLTV